MVNSAVSIILVLVALIHLSGGALTTTKAGSTLTRFNDFISVLTTVPSTGIRAVHSSGGAAGGVVSEGQGYGLLIGGITAASLGTSHASFDSVVQKTYEIFSGWKKMCMLSTGSSSCQTSQQYCTANSQSYPCLAHWKFDDSITSAGGTGNAPDGDEDAIIGMIALVKITESVKSKYTWWNEVAKWAYQSCKAFYDANTVEKTIGSTTWSSLRLGACWGGWDCNNPSYHAPGAFRTMKNYISAYATTFGDTTSIASGYVTKFDRLIATSYAMILADQCDTTGLTTNWYVPNNGNPALVGTTGCSGSGTPAGEYGAEAARGVWRVVLDYLWYGSTANTDNYITPLVKHVASKYSNGNFGDLSTGCLVSSVFSSWTAPSNAFIFGPTLTSLLQPVTSVTGQQAMLDTAGTLIASTTISAYYAGSWTAITTFTLNGDLERVGAVIRGGALPPPSPYPPPPPVVIPTPSPVSPSSVITYPCSYAYDNTYWVEVNIAAPAAASVFVECSTGRQIPCVFNYGKYQCNPGSVECLSPRNVVVKGVQPGCCSLGRSCSNAAYAIEDVTASSSSSSEMNIGLLAGVVVACVVLVVLIAFIAFQVKTRYFGMRTMESY